MATVATGRKVPAFNLPATGGNQLGLRDFKGRTLVLYFYPKDDTPGCTAEGQGFRDQYEVFRKAGAEIVGVSRDSVASHEKFKAKYELPFELISDPDETLCAIFNVMREKNMYGRKVMGVERSTFLIDADGVLREEWRKVKVPGHVDEVLEAVKAL
ncbi:MAG TPA: peroxiredoxin [Gammaproteobacteria bacterium]|nr:peroxiredoxin [Gammaproteobacteria bacterium]